jgi:hypothetical protein
VTATRQLGWLDDSREPKPVPRVEYNPDATWRGEHFPKYLVWRKSRHGRLIYGLIESMIERMRSRRSHYGMFALINAARFEYDLHGAVDDEGFKVSNSHSPYLAREYTSSGVAPEGFFELVGGTPRWFAEWAADPRRLDS